MSISGLVEYTDATPEVRAVYDDIMATRKTDWINNFWKALAHDPVTLKRTWESIKQRSDACWCCSSWRRALWTRSQKR